MENETKIYMQKLIDETKEMLKNDKTKENYQLLNNQILNYTRYSEHLDILYTLQKIVQCNDLYDKAFADILDKCSEDIQIEGIERVCGEIRLIVCDTIRLLAEHLQRIHEMDKFEKENN